MAKSQKVFDRWKGHEERTWSYQVLMKYDEELMKLWGAHLSSSKYTYTHLGQNGATWKDSPREHFQVEVKRESFCPDLRSWSNAFNSFDNWVNHTVVLTLASNLETYFASVIRLALESDPAILLGVTRTLDGDYVLKRGKAGAIDFSEQIESCTKGDWGARMGAIREIFGSCPVELEQAHCGVRNRFGHAFGRDIEEARRTGKLDVLPIGRMTRERVERYRARVLAGAKSLDQFLSTKHIGEFEAILFYHRLFPTLNKRVNRGQRSADFKKAIGSHGATRGKLHCLGLVKYYESL